jgi:hypothetical protein
VGQCQRLKKRQKEEVSNKNTCTVHKKEKKERGILRNSEETSCLLDSHVS